jgi:hypothetical protein
MLNDKDQNLTCFYEEENFSKVIIVVILPIAYIPSISNFNLGYRLYIDWIWNLSSLLIAFSKFVLVYLLFYGELVDAECYHISSYLYSPPSLYLVLVNNRLMLFPLFHESYWKQFWRVDQKCSFLKSGKKDIFLVIFHLCL